MASNQSVLLRVGKKGQDVNTQVPERCEANAQHVIRAPVIQSRRLWQPAPTGGPFDSPDPCVSHSVYEPLHTQFSR